MAVALAHLCEAKNYKTFFVDNRGLELLTSNLTHSPDSKNVVMALYKLATKVLRLLNLNEPNPSQHGINLETVSNVYETFSQILGLTEACIHPFCVDELQSTEEKDDEEEEKELFSRIDFSFKRFF
ncbi:hypothetical protein OROMI_019742 [Orobanche minor]